jgi:fructose-specific phosphotransferase system IIA component
MNLGELMNSRGIVKLNVKDKTAALEKLVDVLSKRREVGSKEKLRRAVKDREKILSTGIGGGIAVPHAKIPQVKKFCAVVGISKTGIHFDSLDGKPVHVVFMIAAPENSHDEYLRILKQLAHTLKDEQYKNRLINAKDANQVIEIFSEIEY